MADYGLKYCCEYRSPMRDSLLYRIEIAERDYVPAEGTAPLMIRPYDDVFTIKWGQADDPEHASIKGSSMTLKLLCVEDMAYLSLFTVDALKYRVTVYEYRGDSWNPVEIMLWRGFLSANNYKENFAKPPYVVTLSATDGFALLGSMPFRDAAGLKRSARISLYQLLSDCIAALNLDLPVVDWLGIGTVTAGHETLKSVFIDQSRLYYINQDITWSDVLKFCIKPFLGQIFQAGGVIHVRRIASLQEIYRPALFYQNEELLGKVRPFRHDLWRGLCDVRSSSDLELSAPLKEVDVSVNNTKISDSLPSFYEKESWTNKTNVANTYFFGDRVVISGVGMSYISMLFPEIFEPANAAQVDVSLTLSNMMKHVRTVGEIAVLIKIGTTNYKWNPNSKGWFADDGSFEYTFSIDPVEGVTEAPSTDHVSIYTPVDKLNNYSFKTTLTTLPPKKTGEVYQLFLRILWLSAAPQIQAYTLVVASDVSVRTSAADSESDVLSLDVPITKNTTNDCSIEIPTRDGGYHFNMKAILTCPLLDEEGEPIVSWLTPGERGDLMHVVANDLLLQRSSVRRQISGEIRCESSVDLNSLFEDAKYTQAIYYINSLELLAKRQVYKVQMRELVDLRSCLPPYELTLVGRYYQCEELCASLYATLFFKTVDAYGKFGVLIFNTLAISEGLTKLPISGDDISIRKGLDAVVIQVGNTDLYAVDNIGNILSHLDRSVAEIVDFSSALYDADRDTWVSFKVKNSVTSIVVFRGDITLESEDEFYLVVSRMLLMSGGYVVDVSGNTYWHNYELHASDKLIAVNDASDATDSQQFRTLAISDTLIVKLVNGRTEIGRRRGPKLQSVTIKTFDRAQSALCCGGMVVLKSLSSRVIYDSLRDETYHIPNTLASANLVASGRAVWGFIGPSSNELYCISTNGDRQIGDSVVVSPWKAFNRKISVNFTIGNRNGSITMQATSADSHTFSKSEIMNALGLQGRIMHLTYPGEILIVEISMGRIKYRGEAKIVSDNIDIQLSIHLP